MCPSGETTSRLNNLLNKPAPLPPLRLFGGKGGVGKTTCAAAAALAAAESGRRVLAVTTDPAPSLGDAFRIELTGEPTPIPTRRGTLLAAEIAAGPALSRWMAEHREPLREIAARGTYLDAEDVDRFLALSLPGADELMAWLEVARLARRSARDEVFDEVIVDAAPTAHTLRLLAMPEAIRRFAGVLDRLQERHRWMAERFGGVWRPDASDALAAGLAAQGREIEERLRDPERCQVFWVMLPEILSLEETLDALAVLDREGIPVREVIVNRALHPISPRDGEGIAEIRTALAGRTLRLLKEEEKEPIGKTALRRVGKGLASPLPEPSPPGPLSRPLPPSLTGRGGKGQGDLKWLDEIAPAGLQILFFGGKGGVGKTTCSAAVALALAERRSKARILLISTDPAHSVADVLEVPLGDDERPVPGAPEGLRARELDAGSAFAKWRERYGTRVDEAAGAFAPDSGGVQDLLDLTPPGIDELIAVSSLLDAVFGDGGEPAYDLVVVDTAPTGHALRLLEMPELALSWDHYLLSLLLKYREALGLGDLAQELVALSRSLKRLEALLRDPARARFVAVTRAAELPRRETVRLLRSLQGLGIAVPAVVVNALPPGGSEVRRPRSFGRCAIIRAPAEFPPPRGVSRLAAWIRSWEPYTG